MSRRSLITAFLLVVAAAMGYAIGLAQEPTGKSPPSGTPQLKTLDEQANVKKLLDFVASTTQPSN